MKKYDTYKDSGNQWIGQVPEHWCLYSLKYYLNLQKGRKPEVFVEEGDLPYVTMDYIRSRENKTCLYPSSAEGLVPISDDDILVLWDGANAGEIVKAKKGFLSSTMAVLDFDKKIGSHQYLFYLLKQMEPIFKTFANGTTIPHFDSSILLDYKYPLPPLTEQEAIANFLDKKTGEIDQAIALFEQEKTDLQAYRKAIISETVTKGLNPNAKLKDSGIQWIGQIPEEWKTPKLSYITSKIGSGSTPRGGAETYVTSGVKFIRSQNVYDTGLRLEDVVCITDEVNESMKNSQVQVGDILYNITGGSIGRCYIVDDSLGPANVNQHVCIVRPCNVYGRFLLYNLQSEVSQYQLRILQSGGNREGLTAEAFKDFIIPLPPLSEQEAIVAFLDKKTSDIDTAIERINAQITELQAYRTALISEAVTGKIDVRN